MSKSSTVTVRETPVPEVASVAADRLRIHAETVVVQTHQRIELVDLTDRVMGLVRAQGIREGLASLWSMHTTCCVFINEYQTALLQDIRHFLEDLVDRDAEWRHNDPAHSDCDRGNATSHLRSLLLGNSITIPIREGKLLLGRFQSVIFAELDGPQTRSIVAHVMGV